MEVCVFLLIGIYIIFLFCYFRPSIDIVLEGTRYKILLWYNKYDWDDELAKDVIKRNYIKLIKI